MPRNETAPEGAARAITGTNISQPIRVGDNGQLLCPLCGDEWTHVNVAYFAQEHDYKEVQGSGVRVSQDGQVTRESDPFDPPVEVPAGQAGPLRSHRFALVGYCEAEAHTFALIFAQHKGHTFVEVAQHGWTPA